MKIEEITVDSWSQLNEVLFDEPLHPTLGRWRSNFAFRGVSDASYDLATTLMRLGPDHASVEPHIIRSFQKYAHLEMHEQSSIWNWLALAQHHGLPTRLLDWTYSPYAALHFVTDHTYQFDKDGAIWCVNFVKTNQFLSPQLRSKLEKTSARVFTTGMLNDEVQSLTEFDQQENSPFVVFIEPPSLDARIVNQYGLFSVMSDPSQSMDRWFGEEGLCRKVVIPAELKWEIRDKLDQSNINERVLFPGLDGLCLYLKRYYSPKSPTRPGG
ncbi:MAG: FRG domain-containing protein [Xanthomonadales bacterium]|nr:FRG domain-containing protein [Xanthomonadales bacterium]